MSHATQNTGALLVSRQLLPSAPSGGLIRRRLQSLHGGLLQGRLQRLQEACYVDNLIDFRRPDTKTSEASGGLLRRRLQRLQAARTTSAPSGCEDDFSAFRLRGRLQRFQEVCYEDDFSAFRSSATRTTPAPSRGL